MAEIFDGQENHIFDPSCHIGKRGDIIISMKDTEFFVALSPLEAKELAKALLSSIEEYKKELSEAA